MRASISAVASFVFCLMTLVVPAAAHTAPDDPPFISAFVFPEPNAAGWNHTAVTVYFGCSDDNSVTSCPNPVVVTTEGANQVISGTAVDSIGQTTSTSVTVNIDKTRPTLSVSSPASGTTTSAASIALSATADDTLAGLASASCNGEAATLEGGIVSCSVSLGYGRNFVAVQVTDLADNKRSVLWRINRIGTATTPTVLPAELTLLLNEEHSIRLLDEFGQDMSSVSWSVDDAAVAEVTTNPDGAATVKGLTTGTTNVTLRST